MKITVKEISEKLADRVHEVASMLLPAGKANGNLWECGGVNGHSGKSLKVHLDGSHPGKWRDWSDVEHGDLLDLWSATKGISLPDAIRDAKAFLGIRDEIIEGRKYATPKAEHPQLSADGKAMHWLVTERKLKPEIVNRYRVRGNIEKRAIAFPSYSPSGELVNHSYRTLDAKKEVWQDKGCAPSLWGWHALSDATWQSRSILICEGQIDAMTWAQWGIDALSIPNGGGKTWIDYDWHNLEAFTTIYLAFDMDPAGAENLAEVLGRLGRHRCRIVKTPEKDANACLKAGRTAEEARQWVDKSEYQAIKKLVHADAFKAQVAERFFPSKEDGEGWTIPQLSHRDKRRDFRFRNGELTVWTGTTGHGKSTFLNLTTFQLAAARNEPSLLFSMETSPPEVIYRQIKGVNLTPANPGEVERALEAVAKHLLYYDKIGGIEEPELFEVMHYARARYGVRDVVIDSMMRVGNLEEDYPAQTKFIIKLVTFARETGCHVHLVAHPRKSAGDQSPKSQDISGSGNIRNNADNVLSMWRNLEKERKIEDGQECDEADAIISVEKDRIVGDFRKFPLIYLPDRYRFEKYTPERK